MDLDNARTDPPETDEVVFWTNPDGPDVSDVLDTAGSELAFDCPNPDCPDEHTIAVQNADDDTIRDVLAEHVAHASGTLRCDACGEPILGFFGDGDGNHDV